MAHISAKNDRPVYFPNTYHFFCFPGSTIPCQDGSSKKETKKKAKRRLSFASEDEQVEIKAENPPGDKKTKETSAMSEDEAERLVKEMMKGSGSKAADAEDSDSASEKGDENSSESESEEEDKSEEAEESDDEKESSSDDKSGSDAETLKPDESSSEEQEPEESDVDSDEETVKAKEKPQVVSKKPEKAVGTRKKVASDSEASDSEVSEEEPEVTKKAVKKENQKISKKDKHGKKEDEKSNPKKKDASEKNNKAVTKCETSSKEKKRGREEDGKKAKNVETKRSKDKQGKKEPESKLEVAEAKLGKSATTPSSSTTTSPTSATASADSSSDDKINSSTHHKEYLRYRRWIRNGKRFPTVLGSRLTSEDGRAKLFVDWVKCGGDVDAIICKHEASLSESRQSQVKYGFRSERWLNEKYGEEKAKRIMGRKVNLGLLIPDPEEPEDNLYFCLIDIDLKNINELKRVTSLEAKGQVSEEMIKAFTEAGGCLDSGALKGEMGNKEGMTKAITFMGSVGKVGDAKSKGKNKRGKGASKDPDQPGEAKEVKAETPQAKARALITKVLKDANTCRLGLGNALFLSRDVSACRFMFIDIGLCLCLCGCVKKASTFYASTGFR